MYYTIASSNNQIELIDFNYLGEISAKKELMADELHPNAKGCEIMAGFFFEALKPYLAANNLIKE
jgi:lysophospholipase L1-like esterase